MHLQRLACPLPFNGVPAAARNDPHGDAHAFLPAERQGLDKENLEDAEHEPGDEEREVKEGDGLDVAANGFDERVGNARQKANEGETFVDAKPRSNGAYKHGQDDEADAIGNQPVEKAVREKQTHTGTPTFTPAPCARRSR